MQPLSKYQRSAWLSTLLTVAFAWTAQAADDRLLALQVPAGFKIQTVADNIANPRQMAVGDKQTLFVGSRSAGKVYALRDSDGDGRYDQQWLLAKSLNMPSAVAFRDGNLYVAEVNRIIVFENIEQRLADNADFSVLFTELPKERHHGWKFIAFDQQGHLLVPVGVPCNVCEDPDPRFGSLLRIDLKTKRSEIIAKGIRNTVGFAFEPSSGDLYFTDNGRDMMGDDVPPDELNRIAAAQLVDNAQNRANPPHFGFPYFHAGDIPDPEFGCTATPTDYQFPFFRFQAHIAPLGVMFYQGKMFPESYRGTLWVAEHGSWNRSKKVGYKVSMLRIKNQRVLEYKPLVTGFLESEAVSGRPAALLELADGSVLVSDDHANAIYRLTYQAQP